MQRKIISVLTLVAVLIFSWSCVSHYTKKEDVATLAKQKKNSLKVVGVQTCEGEYLEFFEKEETIVTKDALTGYVAAEGVLEIDKSEIVSKKREKRGDYYVIKTKDGRRYAAAYLDESQGKIILTKSYSWTSIPLSQAEFIWVRKSRAGAGVYLLGVVAFVAILLGALSGSSSSPPPSRSGSNCCPFVYSYDGDKYMFDAEPYGGAICQGLERTEWCVLENLKEVNGQYKILVANELDETQYTNEIALLIIDHPKGTTVLPDVSGNIHTIAQPVIPLKAFDGRGNDFMPLIFKNDRVYWSTRMESRNPDRKEDLRDELILEFPKPQNAKKAKLVVNACTTLWGSQMVKEYLDLYGDSVHDWFDSLKNKGPAYYEFVNMHLKDELYALNIRVKTEKGWISKGLIRGGGPFISKDKVYPLDLTDVESDVLAIKLTPPTNFWMINHIAVDYSENCAVGVKELKPFRAVDNNGRNIGEVLASDDADYYKMPNRGDQAELVFETPPQVNDMQRTLILKAKGYYDIHLDAQGEPQLTMIERLHKEPGFVVRHALKKYIKWKDEIMKEYLFQ